MIGEQIAMMFTKRMTKVGQQLQPEEDIEEEMVKVQQRAPSLTSLGQTTDAKPQSTFMIANNKRSLSNRDDFIQNRLLAESNVSKQIEDLNVDHESSLNASFH